MKLQKDHSRWAETFLVSHTIAQSYWTGSSKLWTNEATPLSAAGQQISVLRRSEAQSNKGNGGDNPPDTPDGRRNRIQ